MFIVINFGRHACQFIGPSSANLYFMFRTRRSVDVMLEETTKALNGGRFPHLKYLNLGGGLGIDYRKDVSERRAMANTP